MKDANSNSQPLAKESSDVFVGSEKRCYSPPVLSPLFHQKGTHIDGMKMTFYKESTPTIPPSTSIGPS